MNLTFRIALLLLLSLPGLAQQLTLPQMYAKIDQSFPDNVAGKISAAGMRSRLKDLALMLDQKGTADAQPMTIAAIRAISATVIDDKFNLVFVRNRGKQGYFVYDDSDQTSADDGVLVLVSQSGRRYKRYLPEGRITPEIFGAIANDGIDDAAALVAFYNATGWTHLLPDNSRYDCSVAINRVDKGNFNHTGRGTVNFFSDTYGLTVVNTLNGGHYGSISIQGPTFNSGGTKSAGREALVVTSQHEGPAPIIRDVKITCTVAGREWTTGIHTHDCSNAVVETCDIQGASTAVCTAISVTNSANRPAVNNTFETNNIRNVYQGYSVVGTGYPSTEGTRIKAGEVVNATRAVYGKVDYPAPIFLLQGVHMYAAGKECVRLEGFSEVSFASCSFYSDINPTTGEVPARAVYLKDIIDCEGNLSVSLLNNTPYAVEFAGSGGMVDMNIRAKVQYGASSVVFVPATGYDGSLFGLIRQPTGTLIGSNTGGGLIGPGRLKFFVHPSAQYANDKSLLQYDASSGFWKASDVGNKFVQGQFANSRATNITDVTGDVPSGFYTLSSSANVPADPSGFNNWFFLKNRLENGSNSGDRWSGDYLINLKTKKTYFGGYDAQTGAMAPWKLALTTPDVPVAGDLMYYDGTDWKRIPKGTNGQFLKMVSGLPAWSN